MRLIPVNYYGFTAMDRRFSSPMLPWIVSEIRKRDTYEKLSLAIEDGFLQAYNSDFEVQYAHKLSQMTRFSQADMDPCTFLYLLRDDSDHLLYCYLYQASKPPDVLDLYQQMKDNSNSNPAPIRSQSSAANLTSLCVDISPSSSNFFEVLYIGKIKVWNRKVPDSFIDDALEKFKAHDLDKSRRKLERLKSESNLRRGSIDSQAIERSIDRPMFLQRSQSVITNLGVKSPDIDRKNLKGIGQINEADSKENSPASADAEKSILNGSTISLSSETSVSEQQEPESQNLRLGSASTDDHNRTMVLQIDRTDLRLISPDRKVILLHKHHKDVTTCIQGLKNAEHFGFICKETSNLNTFIGFVFKCESPSVASEAVGAISQSFTNAEMRSKNMVTSCEHCPMVWYHKLCCEIENMTDKKTQAAIMRKIEQLDYEEQDVILTKFRGVETDSLRDQNEFLMMLLRAHCEMKQGRHIHDTPESRSEFLNQYLGGSTIFMKAKRSLTTSFDNLLKRRASKDDFNITSKDMSLPIHPINPGNRENSPNNTEASDSEGSRSSIAGSQSDLRENHLTIKDSRTPEKNLKSPMMDIFLKVGSSPKSSEECSPNKQEVGSWRQAIFKTVVTPSKPTREGQRRTKDELRALWKNSIHQAVLLIRMEKENARLRARQEETAVKRIKLEYDELKMSECTNAEIWDLISNKETKVKYDEQILLNAIKQGIPRGKRGDVWNFMAEEFIAHLRPIPNRQFPNYLVSYETLLRQLTSHQHAILIDLGRTFPSHSYYSSPLGPGQLALFNLLKAYSLLDPEVGYCQGLSFVAGVLLLHMEESQAFSLLRHLMFRRDLRKQYLPDMVGLQIRLYQLSRLLHDQVPELYEHFDAYEVAPTLYAAPWLLTIFASQFPLGFVTRVFDLMFLESPDVVFRVALALLSHHKDELMACENFEEIMNFLKVKLPAIEKPVLEKVMNQVYTTDISKQLHEYQVEYHVLQEEMQSVQPHVENVQKLEEHNKALARENRFLATQLEISVADNKRLEQTRGIQQSQLNQLKMQNRGLEVTVATLASFINTRTDLEIPGDIRRILTQISTAERQKSETKNNFLNNMFRKTGGNERVMVKSLSTGRIRNIPNIEENPGFFSKSHNHILTQRRLSEEVDEIEPSLPLVDKIECDKASPTNSIDSGVETPLSPNHHPLSSCDVNFSYHGTKELKKIGSLRTITRTASVDIVGK